MKKSILSQLQERLAQAGQQKNLLAKEREIFDAIEQKDQQINAVQKEIAQNDAMAASLHSEDVALRYSSAKSSALKLLRGDGLTPKEREDVIAFLIIAFFQGELRREFDDHGAKLMGKVHAIDMEIEPLREELEKVQKQIAEPETATK